MSTIQQSLQQLLTTEGATGAAIVDLGSGMALGTAGHPGFSLDVAAAGNANVVRSILRVMEEIEQDDEVDDVLITLGSQYHLISVLHEESTDGLLLYLTLSRRNANLALARHKLNQVARTIQV